MKYLRLKNLDGDLTLPQVVELIRFYESDDFHRMSEKQRLEVKIRRFITFGIGENERRYFGPQLGGPIVSETLRIPKRFREDVLKELKALKIELEKI